MAKWPKSRFLRSCSLTTSPDRCESRPEVKNGQNAHFEPVSTVFRSPRGYFWGYLPRDEKGPKWPKYGKNGQNRDFERLVVNHISASTRISSWVKYGQSVHLGAFSTGFRSPLGYFGGISTEMRKVQNGQNMSKIAKSRVLRSCSLTTSAYRCESLPWVKNWQKHHFGPFSTLFRSRRTFKTTTDHHVEKCFKIIKSYTD